jgi:serine/threonine protein kinase
MFSIFLVLDFLEHDLKTLLEEMPEPFLTSEIKTLLLQLVSGVLYLHNTWILHRDLKTSNLLLNNRGVLKIADFGMARYFGDPPPKMTQLVVTLWYRAPELLLGTERYGTAVDMWSMNYPRSLNFAGYPPKTPGLVFDAYPTLVLCVYQRIPSLKAQSSAPSFLS